MILLSGIRVDLFRLMLQLQEYSSNPTTFGSIEFYLEYEFVFNCLTPVTFAIIEQLIFIYLSYFFFLVFFSYFFFYTLSFVLLLNIKIIVSKIAKAMYFGV